jgi:hypothetical protein
MSADLEMAATTDVYLLQIPTTVAQLNPLKLLPSTVIQFICTDMFFPRFCVLKKHFRTKYKYMKNGMQ